MANITPLPCECLKSCVKFPDTVRATHSLPRFYRFMDEPPQVIFWNCNCILCGRNYVYEFEINCGFDPEEDNELIEMLARGQYPKDKK